MRPTAPSSSSEQEYPYGWRFVKRMQPDGTETLDQVALTLEDVLHPQEGDVIPENSFHESDCTYLATVFRSRPIGPPFALVTRDLLIDWGVEGIRNHSPDVAVFVGLDRDPGSIGTLDLRGLHGRCQLIIEVVSPSTRENDVIHKFSHYYTIGIPIYIIIDQLKEGGPRSLRAYRRKPDRYVEIESDDRGRVDLPQLGLMLGLRDGRVACYDLGSGEELGDYSKVYREWEEAKRLLEAADRRAEQQEQEMEQQITARQKAERQAADALSEFEKQRQEAEKQRQEAEKQRQEAEKQQQEAEKQRQEAEKQRQEVEKQQQEADRQRRAREAADHDLAARDQLIRELQEKLRLLQTSGGSSDPTS